MARARCIVAEAEIALVSRDLGWPIKALEAARATLERHGDRVNAAHARYLQVRRFLLIGQIDQAERLLAGLDPTGFPPAVRAAHELVVAGIALRRLRAKTVRSALARAECAARLSAIPTLVAEVESAFNVLDTPAARLMAQGEVQILMLEEVEALLASGTLVIDACRHAVRQAGTAIALARRPVLFALARALGEAWPGEVTRALLIARAFRAKVADESHRARLRVEVGRLRTLLRPLADVSATKRGFALVPRSAVEVAILARPVEEQHAAVLATLADGEVMVELGARAGAWRQPAYGTAGARFACGKWQGAVLRLRTRSPLDKSVSSRIHDDLVTPGSTARRIVWKHGPISGGNPA